MKRRIVMGYKLPWTIASRFYSGKVNGSTPLSSTIEIKGDNAIRSVDYSVPLLQREGQRFDSVILHHFSSNARKV